MEGKRDAPRKENPVNTPTPFDRAWHYILDNDGAAAEALAKYILFFWNHYDYPCTLHEIIAPLDSERKKIAVEMTLFFFEHGAEEAASRYINSVFERFPKLRRKAAKAPDSKTVADLIWKSKRILYTLGVSLANHDFADANAEAGRLRM